MGKLWCILPTFSAATTTTTINSTFQALMLHSITSPDLLSISVGQNALKSSETLSPWGLRVQRKLLLLSALR